ncbi:uncharacterized protein LY89DRAFT_671286 [Mollisia scopiformis]|uniref:Uncharacterized protein n=1 Tax=Mollisia scopiformis TaxID=149040 RepID=A0A194X503_MOLSC|nr:uncharacterized protein LY89DRAFT_671286 [Mollisia scopiformis]KUJ14882.1 hypothetical protein LY89DRAFT_671286 [Mollisia scopiformis]
MTPATEGLLAGFDPKNTKSMRRFALSLYHWKKGARFTNSAHLHGLTNQQITTLEAARLRVLIDPEWDILIERFLGTPRNIAPYRPLMQAAKALADHAAGVQAPNILPVSELLTTPQSRPSIGVGPTVSEQTTITNRGREPIDKPLEHSNTTRSVSPISVDVGNFGEALQKIAPFPSSSRGISPGADMSWMSDLEDEALRQAELDDMMKSLNHTPASEVLRNTPGPALSPKNKLAVGPSGQSIVDAASQNADRFENRTSQVKEDHLLAEPFQDEENKEYAEGYRSIIDDWQKRLSRKQSHQSIVPMAQHHATEDSEYDSQSQDFDSESVASEDYEISVTALLASELEEEERINNEEREAREIEAAIQESLKVNNIVPSTSGSFSPSSRPVLGKRSSETSDAIFPSPKRANVESPELVIKHHDNGLFSEEESFPRGYEVVYPGKFGNTKNTLLNSEPSIRSGAPDTIEGFSGLSGGEKVQVPTDVRASGTQSNANESDGKEVHAPKNNCCLLL